MGGGGGGGASWIKKKKRNYHSVSLDNFTFYNLIIFFYQNLPRFHLLPSPNQTQRWSSIFVPFYLTSQYKDDTLPCTFLEF